MNPADPHRDAASAASASSKGRTQVSRWVLTKWLVGTTRPVLRRLIDSTISRILNQLLGITLLVLPVVFFANAYLRGENCDCVLGEESNAWGLAGMMALVALVKAVFSYLEQYFGHLVAFKALELLRGEAYRSIAPQTPAIVARSHTGDLLDRLTKDIDRIEVFFAHTFAPAVSAVVVPGVVIATTFWLAPWQMGLAVTLVLLIGELIPWLGMNAGHRAAGEKMRLRGSTAVSLTDSVNGLTEVVGYGMQTQRLEQLEQWGSRLGKAEKRYVRPAAMREALMMSWRMASLLILLGVGGWLWGQNQGLSLTVWLACLVAVLRCWDVLNGIASFGVDLNISFAAADRVYRLTHAGLELPQGPAEAPPGPLGLRFEDVTYNYQDRGTTLDTTEPVEGVKSVKHAGVSQVNLQVKPGSWTSLVGATGSGKSTLTRLALRYFDPDRGQVYLTSTQEPELAVSQLRLEELWRSVAVVTPDVTLLDLTVAQNLRLADPDASDDRLWWALSMAGIDREIHAREGGLHSRVGAKGSALSGGQRQRLSLAQALLRGSRVLILDEYTSNLNPELAGQVRNNLLQWRDMRAGELTVIEVTHNLDHVTKADWVAVLDLGRIVEQGKPEDLLANPDSELTFLVGPRH